jgi:ABC-2 type transport system permease protein
MTVHLALTELKLLLRKRITAFSVLAVPLLVCALAWFADRGLPDEQWGAAVGTRFVVLLLMSVFMVSTTVYTARRQSLVLQRLRTSELSDRGVHLGIGAPIVLIGLVQVLVYFGFCLAIGAPLPADPDIVLLGLVLGVAVSLLAGIATAAFSRSVEATQVTAVPVMMAAIAGVFMARSSTEAVATAGVYLPMVGPGDLVAKGWSGGEDPLLGLSGTAPWLAVFLLVAIKLFRWEPRQ